MAALCTKMRKHIFLTGEKGVGKSTIIRSLLRDDESVVGGFYTIKTDEVYDGRYSVHLIKAGTKEKPSAENMLFFCREDCGKEKTQRFDRLGCEALQLGKDVSLIIMDELGPNEGKAEKFCSRVEKLLDGSIPILGVLQKADSDFLRTVASHPKVEVIEVTEDNRDMIPQKLKNR